MNLSNKDTPVRGYFRSGLFDRMEKMRTERGQSRSGFIETAVDAWIKYGVNHIPAPAANSRAKLAPNRRQAPRIHLRQ